MERKQNYSGTEEQYHAEYPDTNCNDDVRMEIHVNGQKYLALSKTINTQQEWYRFQTELMSRIEDIQLTNLSRFKA